MLYSFFKKDSPLHKQTFLDWVLSMSFLYCFPFLLYAQQNVLLRYQFVFLCLPLQNKLKNLCVSVWALFERVFKGFCAVGPEIAIPRHKPHLGFVWEIHIFLWQWRWGWNVISFSFSLSNTGICIFPLAGELFLLSSGHYNNPKIYKYIMPLISGLNINTSLYYIF